MAEPPVLTWRFATVADAAVLAPLNRQLIEDEGHRNDMTVPQLAERMRGFLDGDYRAVLFEHAGRIAAYALWRDETEHVYLRQYFVARDMRRLGIGRAALAILRGDIWPRERRVRIEVLTANARGIAFWRGGFEDYALTMELEPAARP